MIKKLYFLVTFNNLSGALIFLVTAVSAAIFDFLGVASLMPFVALVTNPDLIESNYVLSFLYNSLSFTSADTFIIFIGAAVFVSIFISLSFRSFASYVQIKFVFNRELEISRYLLSSYLQKDYEWFLGKHSSDISKMILSESQAVSSQGIWPFAVVLSQGLIFFTIALFLFIVDPLLAILSASVLGGGYLIVFACVNQLLHKSGEARLNANNERFKSISEALHSIKEIKLFGYESIYIERFQKSASEYSNNKVIADAMAQIPRYVIELIAFGGMIAVLLYLLATKQFLSDVIAIIAVYAFGAYRLLPALQMIYRSCAALRFIGPAVDRVYQDLQRPQGLFSHEVSEIVSNKKIPEVENIVEFRNTSFRYEGSDKFSIKNLNLHIKAGMKVGVVGPTGSGKTTFVDLCLGLLNATHGNVVNFLPVSLKDSSNKIKSIGYVPQDINLLDDTISKNIAFGVENSQVDFDLVKKAAQQAFADEFIEKLDFGFEAMVGEKGARLSGGQKQRLGIARALYHQPSLLVLDEATSALDTFSESKVLEAIAGLTGTMTVIIVAHRLSTIKDCDLIIVFNDGEIVGQGTFDELKRSSIVFQNLLGMEK